MNDRITHRKGILNPRDSAQHFHIERYTPSLNLADFIIHYWVIRWDLRGQPPYVSEVLPYPSVNIGFTANGSTIGSVIARKFSYTLTGQGVIFGVLFKPAGFSSFYNRPLAELIDAAIPITSFFSIDEPQFTKGLLALPDKEMVLKVEALLLAKHPKITPEAKRVNEIVATIMGDRSMTKTSLLSERFGISERSLQLIFKKYVGLGPKWVIMRYRLQEAADRLNHQPSESWTAIANELGYSDQAHFIHDFKKIIGQTPLEYGRNQMRS